MDLFYSFAHSPRLEDFDTVKDEDENDVPMGSLKVDLAIIEKLNKDIKEQEEGKEQPKEEIKKEFVIDPKLINQWEK